MTTSKLNGERVNNHGDELGPWTSWGVRVLYRAYDVTTSLRPGSNLLGVWLGRGVSADASLLVRFTSRGLACLELT